MALDVHGLLTWALIGMLTGAIAGEFLTGRGYGQLGDIGIGVVGALVGGCLLNLLGIPGQLGLSLTAGTAFVGAALLTAAARAMRARSYVR